VNNKQRKRMMKRKGRILTKIRKSKQRFTILEVAQPSENWKEYPDVVKELEADFKPMTDEEDIEDGCFRV
jgi:hypothetical protein